MISRTASIPGEETLRNLKVWSLKPRYQYCWAWREIWESQRWCAIFVISEVRMVAIAYRKPR